MNTSNLSDYQLYELIQNPKLDKDIKDLLSKEFEKRAMTQNKIQDLIKIHEAKFISESKEPLKPEYKLLIFLFPFLIPIQSLFATKMLAIGQKRKWKDYWLYLSLGYFLWTILIIVFSRYFLF